MIRIWVLVSAIGGFLSVAAGALAAHLAAGERTAELLRTGAFYGMVHAAALIAVSAIGTSRHRLGLALTVAGWSFALGILLFSLGLFALALTGIEGIGLVAPFGGVALLIGWTALGLCALGRS